MLHLTGIHTFSLLTRASCRNGGHAPKSANFTLFPAPWGARSRRPRAVAALAAVCGRMRPADAKLAGNKGLVESVL
jgi:hypothetical protein